MPKFKSGDRIILKKDALSPYGSKAIDYWIDEHLEENKVYEVDIIGTYNWKGYVNSVVLKNLDHKGWIPEDIFDLVPVFNEGDLVKIHRSATNDDFKSFNTGIESMNFSNGSVFRVESVNDNFCIKIDKKFDVYFPPTIFQKIEKWCVPCNQNMEGNSKLLEWRRSTEYTSNWSTKGFINDKGVHIGLSSCDYTVLTYNEFVKFIYNPLIASKNKSVKKEEIKEKLLNLPQKWAYQLEQDDLKIVYQWRKSQKGIIGEGYINSILTQQWIIVSEWTDDGYYTICSKDYCESEGFTFLTKEEFYNFIINPWKEKSLIKEETIMQKPLNSTPGKRMVTTCDIGAKVVRGRNWCWYDQDNDDFGIITEPANNDGWARVRWENGSVNSYRIGAGDKYDLYYHDDIETVDLKKSSDVMIIDHTSFISPKSCDISMDLLKQAIKQDYDDEEVHIINNKPKKNLLSNNFKELNVNIHIR